MAQAPRWRERIVVQSKFDSWLWVMDTGLPREAFPRNQAFVDISVFPSLGKQRPSFAQDQPKGYFQLKELHKKSLFSNECWLKSGGPSMLSSMCQDVGLQFDSCAQKRSLCGTVMKLHTTTIELILKWMLIERWTKPSMLSSMCQDVARLQFVSCAEQDTVMIGQFVPIAKAPPKAGAKLLYSPSLIHEFTSLFSPKVIFAGLPAKAFPRNQALVDISVLLWLRKQRPSFAQGQPKGYFQLKEPHRTTKKYSQMNADWKVEKAQYAEFNVRRCGKIAVWQQFRERQPLWNSHDGPELKMLGSMPWCSFPWQNLLPRLAQNCCTVQIWSMSLHPRFRGMWFMQVCLGKPSHGSRPL